MNALLKFQTGKKTAPVTMLLALIFAILAFGPLNIPSENTTPGTGLPDTASLPCWFEWFSLFTVSCAPLARRACAPPCLIV